MPTSFNLPAYLARIGFHGPTPPTLATLAQLHTHHARSVPFENLDPLLGRPVLLDLPALEVKIIQQRRGGYCFEHNTLFAAALDALGFATTPLGARVRWMSPPDGPETGRSHMLVRVDLPEGPYLADVGFGGYLMTEPLRLVRNEEQTTPTGTFRLTGTDDLLTLQLLLPSGWKDMYRFTLEPQFPIDYVVASWYTSTNPRSLFTSNLLVQRVTGDGRLSLFNDQLTERRFDGTSSERTLESAAELGRVLEETFGIDAPAEPEVIWERIHQ